MKRVIDFLLSDPEDFFWWFLKKIVEAIAQEELKP